MRGVLGMVAFFVNMRVARCERGRVMDGAYEMVVVL